MEIMAKDERNEREKRESPQHKPVLPFPMFTSPTILDSPVGYTIPDWPNLSSEMT